MTLKAGAIPCLDVKDRRVARSRVAARTRSPKKEAVL